jgi:hypothetical protein
MPGRSFPMIECFRGRGQQVRPGRHRLGIIVLGVWCAAASWLSTGCERLADYARARKAPDLPALETPIAVARALNAWHQEGRYKLFAYCVDDAQRVVLENTLMAFNRLLVANERAQRRLTEMHDELVASEYDLGYMANSMGLFSRDVAFQSERIDGDRAVVVAQVADRVPLEQYRFVRVADRWIYTPDKPIPELPELISNLAGGVEEFAYQLEQRDLTLAEICSEFRYRVWVRMREIRGHLPSSQPSQTSAPATKPTSRPRTTTSRPADAARS